jgi:hypothetical protein
VDPGRESTTDSAATYLVVGPRLAESYTLPGAAAPTHLRAIHDFSAIDEPLSRFGEIKKGQVIPAGHQLAVRFPSLFEAHAIVEPRTDLAGWARELLRAGKTVIQIGAEIDRSPRQVRRLLGAG